MHVEPPSNQDRRIVPQETFPPLSGPQQPFAAWIFIRIVRNRAVTQPAKPHHLNCNTKGVKELYDERLTFINNY